MQAAEQNSSRSALQAESESAPKPALGPPHDTWAGLLGILLLASYFFFGRMQAENDWIGWTGLLIALAVVFAVAHYFRRAYGFTTGWSSEASGSESVNSFHMIAVLGAMLALVVAAPAVYEHFSDDSMLSIVLSSLGMAMAIVGALRVGLGRARRGTQSSPAQQ